MSHVTAIDDVEIKDLDALAAAAERHGLELVRDQKTYRWWGSHVGDWPLPKGFTAADLGRCDHALRVKGSTTAYEVGLVARRDGKPGYLMLYDFYGGGRGLMEKISKDGARGRDATKLLHEYELVKVQRAAARLGRRCQVVRHPSGMVKQVTVSR